MSRDLPALTGPELIKLLKKDGWEEHGYRTHGLSLKKQFGDKTRATIIPTSKKSLPSKTLGLILGPKQTGIGRSGLLKLLRRHQ